MFKGRKCEFTNNVSGFSHENQCEVKQGVTDGQSSTLSNNITLPDTYDDD